MNRLDASLIIPGLYQGSYPPPGQILRKKGFDTLVLCAREYQPPFTIPDHLQDVPEYRQRNPFMGVNVVYAPNDDDSSVPLRREDLAVALRAAHVVAAALQKRRQVLVTCWAGWNRSGLVSALALHLHLGISGLEAVRLIRKARRKALRNPLFVEALANVRGKNAVSVVI